MWRRIIQAVQTWRGGKPRWIRRCIVAIVGTTILLIGIALIVLPGPAVLVIPLGLAVLASEFFWAQRVLLWMQRLIGRARLKRILTRCGLWRHVPFLHLEQ